jgi:phosphoenolpyruvate synthase/pyruvate phosphate dikinase
MLEQMLVPQLDPISRASRWWPGLPASPGAASGKIVFDADTAEARGRGERIILVREETKPEDIHGFFQAQGILTSRGGKTSHAAVVARGMGKPCVSGCEASTSTTSSAAPPSATPRCTKATWSPSTAATARSMPAKCRRCRPSSTRHGNPAEAGPTRWRASR